MRKNMKSSLLLLFLLIILSSAVPISVNAAWSADTQLTQSQYQDFFPSIAQLNNGNVWVAWQQRITATSTNIYYKIYNGTTWLQKGLPRSFHESSNRTTPFIIQTRNGTVWMFYSERDALPGSYYDIVYKQTNEYGLSWSETFHVTDSYYVPEDRYNNMAPSVVEASNGDIWVFWQRAVLPGPPTHGEIFYRILQGNSWSDEFQLTNFPSYVSINNPSAVQAKNGAIIVFWSADINSNNCEIKYQAYDGASWGPVEGLTQSTGDLDTDPAAASSRTGDIWVVWGLQDLSNDTLDAGNLFYSTSQDNGNTWASETRLTVDGASGMPSLTQVNDKRMWVAWTSNRNGNYEIYYKTSDQLLYHDVAIDDISISDPSIYKGANAQVTVDAVNKGDFLETLTVKCYVNQTLIGTQTTSLPGGSSAALNFSWATSAYALGKYLVKATVDQVPNESTINLGDNSSTKGPILLRTPGDINADGRVNVDDLTRLNSAYGTKPGFPNWDQECDINENNIIDVKDLYILGSNYGQTV